MAKKAKRMMDGGPVSFSPRGMENRPARAARPPRPAMDMQRPRKRPDMSPEEREAKNAARMARREERDDERMEGRKARFGKPNMNFGDLSMLKDKLGPLMDGLGDRLPPGVKEKIAAYTSKIGMPGLLGPQTPLPAQPATTMKKGGVVKPVKRYNKGGIVKGSGCAQRGVKKARMG